MKRRIILGMLVLCFALAVSALQGRPLAAQDDGTVAIDERVLEDTENGQQAHFLVVLKEQADLSGASAMQSKASKGQYVYEQLSAVAERTQPAVTAQLDALGLEYRSYWVNNMIAVIGDRAAVEAIATNAAVASIEPDRAVEFEGPVEMVGLSEEPSMPVEWGVDRINAPDVWAAGHTGEGRVVANQDTGIDWDHPALINQYRGWDGASADHNYHWWDAIHNDISGNGTNPCGFDSQVPCDDNGHGTHTVGTAVGDDGGSNQIGVAPGAEWMGCRNMEEGNGRPSTYTECFQFFLAPTDLQGNNPDPSLAPDVVSNSWSCPIGPPPGGEDCTVNSMEDVVNNVRAAGIFIAESAGNSGPSCGTVDSPIAIFDAVTSVGAINSSDQIASFSSRGPVTVDGSNRLKPDIAAPGVSVRSSVPGGGYSSLSGTSMASPHLAGSVALLLSAVPGLEGDVDTTEAAFFVGADPQTSAQDCGPFPGSAVPNAVFGHGILDVMAACTAAGGCGVTAVQLGTLSTSGTASAPWLLFSLVGIAGIAGAAWIGARRRQ